MYYRNHEMESYFYINKIKYVLKIENARSPFLQNTRLH